MALLSEDGGRNWRMIHHEQLRTDIGCRPAFHPSDANVLYASSGGLYHTADGGQTWERIGRQGPQTFGGYFHPQHRDWIYMTLTEGAPHAGLWLSRDCGRAWETFNELPFANIQRVHFDPRDTSVLRVTTIGGSVWRGPIAPALPH